MRFRPLLVPTLVAAPMLAILVVLGIWQLERREWKAGLIADIEMRMATPPVPVESVEGEAARGVPVSYRLAVAAGHFDHSRAVLLYALGPAGQPGYHVVTPLLRASGPVLLVDRGFVTEALKDPAARPGSDPAGVVMVRGIVRASQSPGLFTPRDEPKKRLFYTRSVTAIAAALDLGPTAPFFLEADATPNPGGWPLGGQTRLTLLNNHLSYALTWFGLAGALVIVYLLYHRSRGRLG